MQNFVWLKILKNHVLTKKRVVIEAKYDILLIFCGVCVYADFWGFSGVFKLIIKNEIAARGIVISLARFQKFMGGFGVFKLGLGDETSSVDSGGLFGRFS